MSNPTKIVQLPSIIQNWQSLEDLIFSIYPRLNEVCSRDNEFLTERTILSTHNEDVKAINTVALNMLPGEPIVLLAADKLEEEGIFMRPSSSEMPFLITRRQFPIRMTFAMTINKFQGQSIKYVGIDMTIAVFSHGHLYVTLSRCTSANIINVLFPPNASNYTTNLVYP
ncbi:hypothetical protein GIB67_009375 [Kingdonia uniflora]|uniref:ATP-dependent DNA helicase n=1 Tax=Kingdonia uniflora TaxID=39325 RepID=A0A7J7N308_9MAGN|nr:hypothetical protein GIB67_009375 [Kingdonia uniflora]